MKNYAKFIFDMDGTLVDSKDAVEKAWSLWATEHNIDVAHILAISHGRPADEVIKELMPHLNIKQEVAKLEAIELSNVDSVKPVRGAIAFLSELQEHDWGIFTSAPRALAVERLKAASIPIPQILVTVEDVQKGKPDPEGYILAAQKLGKLPEQCLVFEDALAGIHSALAAGCDVINITAVAPEQPLVTDVISVKDYFGVSVYLDNNLISI
ncbi:HAD-IA family hydrolase [Vibrio sp. 404]|uniref:HAD-IA family hydrolase n=1 Tax=Vibrio marinisediminis TaxID=2758441 RepID=A0A7W2FMQ7_9VIBR|nr:HAD-IA family hydrolase [Vibrio marinisediminis]MBA5760952.1 HAD-IA family hydrolase [Vibrio marinisediminis]